MRANRSMNSCPNSRSHLRWRLNSKRQRPRDRITQAYSNSFVYTFAEKGREWRIRNRIAFRHAGQDTSVLFVANPRPVHFHVMSTRRATALLRWSEGLPAILPSRWQPVAGLPAWLFLVRCTPISVLVPLPRR